MESPQIQIESQVKELSNRSFEAFGEDLACMLGLEVTGRGAASGFCTAAELKKQFKKLAAVGCVRAQGLLSGSFYLLLDQEAFFTLAGVLVIQPEKIILQNRKFGSFENANEISDAIGEIGNLMTGAFDRIFREEGQGHGHFAFEKKHIVKSWDDALEIMGIEGASRLLKVTFEAKINEFPPVNYTVVYPEALFISPPAVEKAAQQSAAECDDTAIPNTADAQTSSGDVEKIGGKIMSAQTADAHAGIMQVQEESTGGAVYKSIKKITASPAVLPGQEFGPVSDYFGTTSVEKMMRTSVVWAAPDETVEQVLAKMERYESDYVLAGGPEKLEGIVSRADLRSAMSPYLSGMFSQWKRPLDVATLKIRIKWVMTRPVHTISKDASVSELISKFSSLKVCALPVTDETGNVVGIATVKELLGMLVKIC